MYMNGRIICILTDVFLKGKGQDNPPLLYNHHISYTCTVIIIDCVIFSSVSFLIFDIEYETVPLFNKFPSRNLI